MAGKTVKFPLEMKNGVQARNLADLQNNFDVEKIIGYFLDGRLKSWLEARYYEEEAEAIENIDKNASDLAKQLCEVFGVEYDEISIDPKEVERRNKRITKLKQITSDEEIIKNVDSVVFNQEELADLYDLGKEKIYLCEGKFNIPKSKQNLKYITVGSPQVEGLEIEKEVKEQIRQVENDNNQEKDSYKLPEILVDLIRQSLIKDENGKSKIDKSFVTEDDITEDLANFIGENDYVITNNYVVFKTNRTYFETSKEFKVCDGFKRGENNIGYWNKNDNSVKSFSLDGYNDYDTFLGNIQNKIALYKEYHEELGVLLYDLDSKTTDVVCTDWNGKENSFSMSGHLICYQDASGNVKLYDSEMRKYKILDNLGKVIAICLNGSILWYIEELRQDYSNVNCLVEFNLGNNYKRRYMIKEVDYVTDIIYVNKNVYLRGYCVAKETAYWKFDLDSHNFEKKLSFENWREISKKNSKYIVLLEKKCGLPVNVIDMSNDDVFVLCKNCGYTERDTHLFRNDDVFYYGYPFYLVGHYFLYEEGKNMFHPDHYYRINIANRQKHEIYKKED